MAVEGSGTVTAVLGTEHTLLTVTTATSLVLTVNTSALLNGETVILRVYEKTLTTDTGGAVADGQAYRVTYVNAQSDPVKISPPIVSAYSATFTLTQTGGVGRGFRWRVDSI